MRNDGLEFLLVNSHTRIHQNKSGSAIVVDKTRSKLKIGLLSKFRVDRLTCLILDLLYDNANVRTKLDAEKSVPLL